MHTYHSDKLFKKCAMCHYFTLFYCCSVEKYIKKEISIRISIILLICCHQYLLFYHPYFTAKFPELSHTPSRIITVLKIFCKLFLNNKLRKIKLYKLRHSKALQLLDVLWLVMERRHNTLNWSFNKDWDSNFLGSSM